jgi:hypothetical protein
MAVKKVAHNAHGINMVMLKALPAIKTMSFLLRRIHLHSYDEVDARSENKMMREKASPTRRLDRSRYESDLHSTFMNKRDIFLDILFTLIGGKLQIHYST